MRPNIALSPMPNPWKVMSLCAGNRGSSWTTSSARVELHYRTMAGEGEWWC